MATERLFRYRPAIAIGFPPLRTRLLREPSGPKWRLASMNDRKPYAVLFVCEGNICRSPAAECCLRNQAEKAGLGGFVVCDSAGCIGFHAGQSPDDRMARAGRRRGFEIVGRARKVEKIDFARFDLILAMDGSNLRDLMALGSKPDRATRIKRFCDFCSESDNREVPDPYYGGKEGFEHVLNLIEDGCRGILRHAESQLQKR